MDDGGVAGKILVGTVAILAGLWLLLSLGSALYQGGEGGQESRAFACSGLPEGSIDACIDTIPTGPLFRVAGAQATVALASGSVMVGFAIVRWRRARWLAIALAPAWLLAWWAFFSIG